MADSSTRDGCNGGGATGSAKPHHLVEERIPPASSSTPAPFIRDPLVAFERSPLEYFKWVSSELMYCDYETGRRRKHQPWAMQIAWNSVGGPVVAPTLKTVGIHTVQREGIAFFTRRGSACNGAASIVCVCGNYPYEQQWRATGFLHTITLSECELMGIVPPPSLVACISACEKAEKAVGHLTNGRLSADLSKLTEHYDYRRGQPSLAEQDLRLWEGNRFVPLTMEVVLGGPSSPTGPHRYAWTRGKCRPSTLVGATKEHHAKNVGMDSSEYDYDSETGWSRVRPILPFPLPSQPPPHRPISKLKNTTVAIIGTHCAGKTTVGKTLAFILQWTFHPELGDVLRGDANSLVPGGHVFGDGSGRKNAKCWDDRVHDAEIERDNNDVSASMGGGRIVETWHIGNLAWAMFRWKLTNRVTNDQSLLADTPTAIVQRANSAIANELTRKNVLLVHLRISPEDSVRRRHIAPTGSRNNNSSRIPMEDEYEECIKLHQALDIESEKYLINMHNELGVPMLIVNNSTDGNVDGTSRKIVEFINEQQWRRAF
jgi:hypothetical protein